MRSLVLVGLVSVTGLAASAEASLFSFASDSNPTGFTFRGTAAAGGVFSITNDITNLFQLVIDDNPGGLLSSFALNTRFEANFSAAWITSVPLAGPTVRHIYGVSAGSGGDFVFRFRDAVTNDVLLTASLDSGSQGTFGVVGTSTTWGTSGEIRADDLTASVRYTATQALVDRIVGLGLNPAAYGIFVGGSVSVDDFGFTLTVLNANSGGLVQLGQDRLPTSAWSSEGSYSGSATSGVPSPGAAALLGLGGLVLARRRR